MKKTGFFLVLSLVYFTLPLAAGAGVKNPDTFVLANYGTLRTLDPAVSYDDSGSQRIWNLTPR